MPIVEVSRDTCSAQPIVMHAGRRPAQVSAEDQARADLYALIAALLLRPPTTALLSAIAVAPALPGEQSDSALDQTWTALVSAAAATDRLAVEDEFNTLFISVGTPAINPYGSRYLAGFMMEKPLAALRDDLASLGLARARGVTELEDHLGALCEIMRVLVAGTADIDASSVQQQKAFFLTHIAPWYSRCLDDMRAADSARFYRCVADFCAAFFAVEFQAFEMDDAIDSALFLEG
jgi:TorA maturation chaperone TorD